MSVSSRQQENDQIWSNFLASVATLVNKQTFETWFKPMRLGSVEGTKAVIDCPSKFFVDWVSEHHTDKITFALRSVLGTEAQFMLQNANDAPPEITTRRDVFAPVATAGSASTRPRKVVSESERLNPKYMFDEFVVGNGSRMTYAACLAVSERPAQVYNPLFIYGGVGMGKTHLMHAIGRELLDKYPAMRVVYTSSERFMNEMIQCLRTNRMQAFQRHYRSADVLLVDDVQILAGKERMQEEFFHTFNELFDHQKQIVISSDSTPKSTPGLVERLRSRFEWGLMVDVQPPDLETKMAILDKKSELEGVALPEEVRIYIATKTKSNVRELEGALIKLIAYSSMTKSPITLQMAQQVLKYLIGGGERRISMDSILRAVAEKFTMQPQQLKQKSNSRQIAYPRQIAMYLMKDLTQASLPEIGRVFGGKHHTTVLHSVQKIERLRHTDTDLNRLIHNLIDSIH
jgi:chromosomal replication initiator protein